MTVEPRWLWAEEIRAYLLGRTHRHLTTGTLPSPRRATLHPPAFRWWIFEGKRYAPLPGPLAGQWATVAHQAQLLLATYNPRLRLTDHPDGQVDWPRTLARGVPATREYVAAAASVGLSEAECGALLGWASWIYEQWQSYTSKVEVSLAAGAPSFESFLRRFPARTNVTEERLVGWAHVTRRSRWPFLRHVVAETLRCALEPSELDRLPLPDDPPTLFELLCIVRLARGLAPAPDDIGWLDLESSGNELRLPGARCRYQRTLPRASVLASGAYEPALAESMEVLGVGVPERVDLYWELTPARGGFGGLIVEAKSGKQTGADTVAQLRAYRAAIPRSAGQRLVVWGIAEQAPPLTEKQLDWVQAKAAATGDDLWVFSGPDDIAHVLEALGLSSS